MRPEIVLRVDVRRRQVQLGVLADLGDLSQDHVGVPRADTGIDHEGRAAAHDDGDVRDERRAAVRYHMNVVGDLSQSRPP